MRLFLSTITLAAAASGTTRRLRGYAAPDSPFTTEQCPAGACCVVLFNRRGRELRPRANLGPQFVEASRRPFCAGEEPVRQSAVRVEEQGQEPRTLGCRPGKWRVWATGRGREGGHVH